MDGSKILIIARRLRTTVLSVAALCLAPTSHAGIMLLGDVAAGTGVLTFTADYSFDITANGTTRFLVFDEWGSPNDGSQTFASASGLFTLLINGVDSGASITNAVDNLALGFNDISSDDAYMFWNINAPVVAGDTVTIASGSWSLAATPSWNSAVSGAFTGNVFLTDSAGVRVSGLGQASAVPVPGSLALLGLGLFGIAARCRAIG